MDEERYESSSSPFTGMRTLSSPFDICSTAFTIFLIYELLLKVSHMKLAMKIVMLMMKKMMTSVFMRVSSLLDICLLNHSQTVPFMASIKNMKTIMTTSERRRLSVSLLKTVR